MWDINVALEKILLLLKIRIMSLINMISLNLYIVNQYHWCPQSFVTVVPYAAASHATEYSGRAKLHNNNKKIITAEKETTVAIAPTGLHCQSLSWFLYHGASWSNEFCYSPLDDMLVYSSVLPSILSCCPYPLIPMGRDTLWAKSLAQQHNDPWPGVIPGRLDLESYVLTTGLQTTKLDIGLLTTKGPGPWVLVNVEKASVIGRSLLQ